MNKIYLTFLTIALIFGINPAIAEIQPNDFNTVIKITKKVCKLSNTAKIDELDAYFSDNYKSFDGYNKQEMKEIAKMAHKLYPNVKSKEKITKIEAKDDYIRVYIDETSTTKANVKGADAKYAPGEHVKGRMKSSSSYCIVYKKENNTWKIITDEIYNEETKIIYGEALKYDFKMEGPKKLEKGEEFCVKTILEMPSNRFVMGSIGHDKIVFPPEKYFDPYRQIDEETGVLERVMIANKEGKNEYINSTFAFIGSTKSKKTKQLEPSVTGMGIYIQRVNLQ